jgi:hypothetical protein
MAGVHGLYSTWAGYGSSGAQAGHPAPNSRPMPNLLRSEELSAAVVQFTYRVHIVLISTNLLNRVL